MQLDNTTILITTGIVAIIGITFFFKKIGNPLIKGSRKTVFLLRNRDKRFKEISIVNETDLSLQSMKNRGITRHFIKMGPGWTDEDKPRTIFLALEAFAYTLFMDGGTAIKITLAQALSTIWGKEAYDKIPKNLREQVEHDTFGITLSPKNPPKTPEGVYASNEARHSESDRAMIDYYARKVKEGQKKMDWTILILGVLAGFGITYLAVNMHWIRVA